MNSTLSIATFEKISTGINYALALPVFNLRSRAFEQKSQSNDLAVKAYMRDVVQLCGCSHLAAIALMEVHFKEQMLWWFAVEHLGILFGELLQPIMTRQLKFVDEHTEDLSPDRARLQMINRSLAIASAVNLAAWVILKSKRREICDLRAFAISYTLRVLTTSFCPSLIKEQFDAIVILGLSSLSLRTKNVFLMITQVRFLISHLIPKIENLWEQIFDQPKRFDGLFGAFG